MQSQFDFVLKTAENKDILAKEGCNLLRVDLRVPRKNKRRESLVRDAIFFMSESGQKD